MSLYKPFFYIKKSDDKNILHHNFDGALGFSASQELDSETHRIVILAIEEGKRQKSSEIKTALGMS